jgi:hypothetical protein
MATLATSDLLAGCSLGLDASRIQRDASAMTDGDAAVPTTNADGGTADSGMPPNNADGGHAAVDGCPPCVLDNSNLDECCLQ